MTLALASSAESFCHQLYKAKALLPRLVARSSNAAQGFLSFIAWDSLQENEKAQADET
jgi:hypothetical protein